jgi:predicted butyrate kinase (DUF1464 family)
LDALWACPELAEGWAALRESAAKAIRALQVSVSAPRELVVSGRLARLPGLVEALAGSLADVAPLRPLGAGRASAAAHGGALLADGLVGGRHAAIARTLRLGESSGSVLDHVRVAGADTITLG